MKRLVLTAIAALVFSAAPAVSTGGNLLCHLSFDDESKPFKAEVGKDAFVRLGKDERVEGLNKTKWTNEGGDGAVTVQKDTSIAIPVPDVLAKEAGRPYSVLLKLKLHDMATHPVFNMPADKMDDTLITSTLYGRLCLRQHERDVMSRGGYGVVPQDKIFTLLLCFGADSTTAFIDEKQILSSAGLVEGKLAGSRADCSKAGGYFLLRGLAGDPLPANITFYDVKIYDGVVDPHDAFSVEKKTHAENAEGAENKNPPSNTTSPSPVATPTVNNPTSPVATPTANNPASPAGGKNGQTGGATSTNGGATSTQGGGATTPVGTPESAGKETPGKNPDTPTGQSTGKSGSSLTTEKPGKTDFPKPETSTDQGDSSQGSGNKGGGGSVAPSAEVQQVLNTFLADNGLSAAEKIPPLKAYIEKLIDLLEKLAKEANDEETLKWVEENRKKLADKKKGGETTASVPFKPVKPLVQLDFEDSILPLRRPKERLFQNNKEVLAIMTMRILLSQGRDRNSDDKFAAIRNDCYVALQIPDELLREPGHPYSVAIKFKLHSRQGCQSFLNMPADNKSDAMVYLNANGQLAIKQHSKAAGSAVLGGYGFAVGTPQMLLLRFGTDQTTAYLDGKLVFSHNGPLAGSYADCSKAGGYFLIRGDDNKDGDTIDFYDFKVFDGVIDPRNIFGKSWTDDGTGVVMTTESNATP